ncbi:MAG: type II toxin-antitoxin system RelE/ParE family toxin [Polyangia bacterium]
MKVLLTPPARAQLTAAHGYIRSHNPIAAQRFRDRVADALRRLGRFPGIGHAVPEAPEGPYRQILVGKYRFFYRVDGDTIWIVGVWYGAQIATLPRAI